MKEVTVIIMNKNYPKFGDMIRAFNENTSTSFADVIIANAGQEICQPFCEVIQCTGGSISKDFQQAIKLVKTKYVVGLGSDCFPQKDWLINAVEDFDKNFPNGIGILALNDGKQCGAIATMCLTTIKTINEVFNGELYDTRFMHYFADTLITYIAKKKGIYAYSERAKVFHHYEQDHEEEKRCWKYDEELYNKLTKEIDDGEKN